jgi:cell division protein FtsB
LDVNRYISKTVSLIRRKPLTVLVGIGVVWLLFFDRDSIFYQLKINREINQLKKENEMLKKQIDSTKKLLEKMNDKSYLERYAREELLLRKANEDIYLTDTTKYEKQ